MAYKVYGQQVPDPILKQNPILSFEIILEFVVVIFWDNSVVLCWARQALL